MAGWVLSVAGEEAQPLGGEGVGVIRAMKDFALREHAQTIEPHVTIVQGMYAGQERQNLLLQVSLRLC